MLYFKKGGKRKFSTNLKANDCGGFRQLISLLLGIRKDFIDRGLDKAGIWVDKEHYMISYYNDWVCKVYLDNDNKLQYELNEE